VERAGQRGRVRGDGALEDTARTAVPNEPPICCAVLVSTLEGRPQVLSGTAMPSASR
jgi:hypothetical protein